MDAANDSEAVQDSTQNETTVADESGQTYHSVDVAAEVSVIKKFIRVIILITGRNIFGLFLLVFIYFFVLSLFISSIFRATVNSQRISLWH